MKIFGCILILISSICCAFFYEKSLNNKIKIYEEIIDFIKYAKNQIEYFSTPVDKIFTSYESKQITDLLKNKSVTPSFSDESEKINEFFSLLGKGYKKEELQLCDYYISYFEDIYTKKLYEQPTKVKIFRAMSLFFGATTIIFLV